MPRDPSYVPPDVQRFNKAIADERKERKRQREAAQRQKVIDEAEQAKIAAAAEVRAALENPKASRERREAADAAYRRAVVVWKAVVAGEDPPPEVAADEPAEQVADEVPADDEATADEPAPAGDQG